MCAARRAVRRRARQRGGVQRHGPSDVPPAARGAAQWHPGACSWAGLGMGARLAHIYMHRTPLGAALGFAPPPPVQRLLRAPNAQLLSHSTPCMATHTCADVHQPACIRACACSAHVHCARRHADGRTGTPAHSAATHKHRSHGCVCSGGPSGECTPCMRTVSRRVLPLAPVACAANV